MASSELRSGQGRRVVAAPSAPNTGALPLDAVYEILLRLPAKELCRLRTVSRPWRTLLSDPQFAAAHAARHPGPLIIASYRFNVDHDSLVDIMDLSGRIVKKVRRKKDDWVESMALDLIHVKNRRTLSNRLLNPATGAVHDLFDRRGRGQDGFYLFGQSASKGEYKVLRRSDHILDLQLHDLFEVCTLNNSGHATWRGKQPPPWKVTRVECGAVAIDGVAYFLTQNAFSDLAYSNRVKEEDLIITFDLESEAWATIRGPPLSCPDNAFQMFNGLASPNLWHLMLTNLGGSLAVVQGYRDDKVPKLDIWIKNGSLWVKQYSIKVEKCDSLRFVRPLFVLDDKRLVLYIQDKRLLQIYNPRRNTFTDVGHLEHCTGISMYTGNLLSLER